MVKQQLSRAGRLIGAVLVIGFSAGSLLNGRLPHTPPPFTPGESAIISAPESAPDLRGDTSTHSTADQTSYRPSTTQSPAAPFYFGLIAVRDSHLGRIIITPDGRQFPLRVYETLLTPNDTYGNQWWVNSSGLNTAWDTSPGAKQTTVAVIDTGFALNHNEFINRWHTNNGESGATTSEAASVLNCSARTQALNMSCNLIDDDYDGVVDNETGPTIRENPSDPNCSAQNKPLDKACNNLDDDGNSLIDDVRGWDFSNFDSNVQAGETNPNGSGTTHGTMVSGILGATGNNGSGIAGVNWNTKILPIQALDDDGYGDTLTVARSVYYAADQDADVISISLGANAADPYLREAIAYALDHGSLVVAASGNEGCNCIAYPAQYPEVLAVGASDEGGNRAGFSSYGASLDVVAPGTNMITPTWTKANPSTAFASGVNGTSFSTPFISGLLAAARSHQPDATWGELVAALTEELDNRGATAGAPHTPSIGYGHVRADNLLRRVTTPLLSAIRYQFGPVDSTDPLDSLRTYQCADGRLATTPLYLLTKGGGIRYTTSELAVHRASESGWNASRYFYTCLGLPNDTLATVRTINMLTELHNYQQIKP